MDNEAHKNVRQKRSDTVPYFDNFTNSEFVSHLNENNVVGFDKWSTDLTEFGKTSTQRDNESATPLPSIVFCSRNICRDWRRAQSVSENSDVRRPEQVLSHVHSRVFVKFLSSF